MISNDSVLGSEFPVSLTLYTQGERLTWATLGSALEAGVGAIIFTIKRKASKRTKLWELWDITVGNTQVSPALASR